MRNSLLAVATTILLTAAAPMSAGSATQGRAEAPEFGRLHHVHLNVSDVEISRAFYSKVFGAVPVSYADGPPALMTEQTFLFLNKVAAPVPSQLQTGVFHLGWSGIDGPNEFAWWEGQGIEFYRPLTPLGATAHYFYLYGPDREVIEIWTSERHHRFNHIHMLASNAKATAEWLALATNAEIAAVLSSAQRGGYSVRFGRVTVHIFPETDANSPPERQGAMQPTDGSGIDHIAFSFDDLDAAYARVRAQGIEIVRPLSRDPEYGFRHFFIRAPNKVLVEMVEAGAWPESAWNDE